MSRKGCASTVQKAVANIKNVQSIETSLEEQKLTVRAAPEVSFDQVVSAVRESGKTVNGGRVVENGTVTEISV